MKILNVALIAGAAYLLFSSFKGKETPAKPDEPVKPDEPQNTQGRLVTASLNTSPTHPLFNQVPLFVKRYYDKKHLPSSPFTTTTGELPPFVSAYTNMVSGIEVQVYEEADYQPGRKICRITNNKPDPLTDEMITTFLASPVKFTNLYWSNKGIALPLKEMPKAMPYNFNVWVLKENLRAVPAALSTI